ncbi:MAG: hypothetical protein ACK5QT_10560 [Oligoflexia bacterium]
MFRTRVGLAAWIFLIPVIGFWFALGTPCLAQQGTAKQNLAQKRLEQLALLSEKPDATAKFAAELSYLVQQRLGTLLIGANTCDAYVLDFAEPIPGSGFQAQQILDRERYRRRVDSLMSCELNEAWRFSLEGGLRLWSLDDPLPGDELSLTVSQALGFKLVRPGEKMDFGIDGRTEVSRRDWVSRVDAPPSRSGPASLPYSSQDLSDGSADTSGGASGAGSSSQMAEFNTLRCFFEGRPGSAGGFYTLGEAGIRDLTTRGRPGLAMDHRDELDALLNLQSFGFSGPIPGSVEYQDTRLYCQILGGYEAVSFSGRCRARFEVGAVSDSSGKAGTAVLFDSRVKLGTSTTGHDDKVYLQAGVSGRSYADGAAYCSVLLGAGADIISRNGCTVRLGAGGRYDFYTANAPEVGDMESFFRDRPWGESDLMLQIFIGGTFSF